MTVIIFWLDRLLVEVYWYFMRVMQPNITFSFHPMYKGFWQKSKRLLRENYHKPKTKSL